MQRDLAGVRRVLEHACEALAGLDEVLYQAGSPELGPLLALVDRVVAGVGAGPGERDR